MVKVILKVDFADDKTKQKAMKKVSCLSGLESIVLDPKDMKLTVTGDIDPTVVVSKLRKICFTEIVSVGPAKEPEKKKKKKKEKKEKKDDQLPIAYVEPPPYPPYYRRSVEEDPNGCVIC